MPGLAAAARPRGDEQDVDQVVGDIEAALIPVNRAAAKRALARLARETLRAKELGKLRKKPSLPPAPVRRRPPLHLRRPSRHLRRPSPRPRPRPPLRPSLPPSRRPC